MVRAINEYEVLRMLLESNICVECERYKVLDKCFKKESINLDTRYMNKIILFVYKTFITTSINRVCPDNTWDSDDSMYKEDYSSTNGRWV